MYRVYKSAGAGPDGYVTWRMRARSPELGTEVRREKQGKRRRELAQQIYATDTVQRGGAKMKVWRWKSIESLAVDVAETRGLTARELEFLFNTARLDAMLYGKTALLAEAAAGSDARDEVKASPSRVGVWTYATRDLSRAMRARSILQVLRRRYPTQVRSVDGTPLDAVSHGELMFVQFALTRHDVGRG
jgi:hypothetical protein